MDASIIEIECLLLAISLDGKESLIYGMDNDQEYWVSSIMMSKKVNYAGLVLASIG